MSYQVITLSIIPNGELPVFHAKQYETGRPIIIDLVDDNGDAYTPAVSDVIKLNCRKVDDNIVILSPDSVTDNRVTFTTTKQLTACSGNNICELRITDSEDKDIATINFILNVQFMPTAGGISSQSQIADLEEQINEMVTDAVEEIAPDVIDDIAPSIVENLCDAYNTQFGGVWSILGEIRKSGDDYIAQNIVSGLKTTSFVEVWSNTQNAFVKEITITNYNANRSYIRVTFEPDSAFLVSPPLVYIHFYNPIS